MSGEPLGATVAELGGLATMMREMVEGQRDLVEEIRNLGELVEGIFWGRNPVRDSEPREWLPEHNQRHPSRGSFLHWVPIG